MKIDWVGSTLIWLDYIILIRLNHIYIYVDKIFINLR